ncbi:MAG TPA: response regulator [Acidimicrobiales bacterium]|nr:response regulator [Acidimicrobiales bacterium]
MDSRGDVLVVDDDASLRHVLGIVLEADGFAVEEASGGEDALRRLAEHAPTAMILDLEMPGLDGWDVLRAKRDSKLAPACRVMVLTAQTAERDFLRAWELGADDYATKPFDIDGLSEKLGDLLAMPPAELEHRRSDEIAKARFLERVERAFTRRA